MSRKGQEVSGNGSRADREASTADCLSEYKLAACAWPSRAAILQITSVVYKLEIALLATSVESSAISLLEANVQWQVRRRKDTAGTTRQIKARWLLHMSVNSEQTKPAWPHRL